MSVFDDLAALINQLQTVAATATAVAGQVETAAGQISSSASTIRQSVDAAAKSAGELTTVVDDVEAKTNAKTSATLGSLRRLIDTAKNAWSQEFQLQLDLIEIGGQRIDDFVRKMGDAQVVTSDGVKTIRELLKDLDPAGLTQEIQSLALAISEGTVSISEGIDLLREKGGALTAQFTTMLEAFLAGEATIEDVEAALRQLKTITKSSAATALAEAIAQAANSGRLP